MSDAEHPAAGDRRVSDTEHPAAGDRRGSDAEHPAAGEPELPRLDPDRAIEAARAGAPTEPEHSPRRPWQPAPPIDTRRYQWMIGGFGLLLVVVFSLYLYARGGASTIGVPAGSAVRRFVAPLATGDLNVAANAHPRCNPARPARRGLNVCGREPLVLAFFTLGATYRACAGEVDVLQRVAPRFPAIHFAAVAIGADRAATLKLIRSHGWTIPVAYDLTGAIGQLYGVSVCPLVELVRPGGIVAQRLIGEHWERPGRLIAAVRRSLSAATATGNPRSPSAG